MKKINDFMVLSMIAELKEVTKRESGSSKGIDKFDIVNTDGNVIGTIGEAWESAKLRYMASRHTSIGTHLTILNGIQLEGSDFTIDLDNKRVIIIE